MPPVSLAGVCVLLVGEEKQIGEEEETERRYREPTTMLIQQIGQNLLSSSGAIFVISSKSDAIRISETFTLIIKWFHLACKIFKSSLTLQMFRIQVFSSEIFQISPVMNERSQFIDQNPTFLGLELVLDQNPSRGAIQNGVGNPLNHEGVRTCSQHFYPILCHMTLYLHISDACVFSFYLFLGLPKRLSSDNIDQSIGNE